MQFHGRRLATSANGAGAIGQPRGKVNLNLNLMPCTKVNPKWIVDVSIKCKTKLLGKMGENLSDLGLDKD